MINRLARKHITWFLIPLFSLYVSFLLLIPGASADVRLSSEIRNQMQTIQQQISETQTEIDDIQAKMQSQQMIVSEKQQSVDDIHKKVQEKEAELQQAQQNVQDNPIQTITYGGNGLLAEIFNNLGYNNAPPIPGPERKVAETYVPNIDFQWGGGRVLNTLYEDVAVKFSGTITSSVDKSVVFYAPGDDGVKLLIDGELVINDWYDKGGGGSQSAPIAFEANKPKQITLWFYENGGGANVWLYWNNEIVPASAFQTQTVTSETDASLVAIVDQLQNELNVLMQEQTDAKLEYKKALDELNALIEAETQSKTKLQTLSDTLNSLQTELNDAIQRETVVIVPVIIPTIEHVPSIEPTPTATPEPSVEPIPSEEPIPEPSSVPEDEIEVVSTPEPTQEPIKQEEVTTGQPQPENLPDDSSVNEENVQSITEIKNVQESQISTVSERVQTQEEIYQQQVAEDYKEQMTVEVPDLSPNAIADGAIQSVAVAAEFVKDLFTSPSKALAQLSAIGSSMTEEERATARKVIVPVILINNIVSTMSISTIRRG